MERLGGFSDAPRSIFPLLTALSALHLEETFRKHLAASSRPRWSSRIGSARLSLPFATIKTRAVKPQYTTLSFCALFTSRSSARCSLHLNSTMAGFEFCFRCHDTLLIRN